MSETSKTSLNVAVAALKRGEIIVFPTETLYGLGGDALNEEAVESVFRLKGRETNAPIPVLVSDEAMLDQVVEYIPQIAQDLMERFWPGPLTLILPARSNIPKPLLNASGGIGVRISSQAIATRLVKALGRPLTATSANPSGKEPARTVLEARNYFGDQMNIFVDGGTLTSKTGSTVAEVQGECVHVVREGDIGVTAMEEILGKGRFIG
jgi:L-threonylcarbamoyladenylate synthase